MIPTITAPGAPTPESKAPNPVTFGNTRLPICNPRTRKVGLPTGVERREQAPRYTRTSPLHPQLRV
ncbi:MAG: hypothetical protein HOQ24_03185 [Mycobacteriaceae bacterium]|nr:hypothetical protein [Mycobacteriaceae bacterium]